MVGIDVDALKLLTSCGPIASLFIPELPENKGPWILSPPWVFSGVKYRINNQDRFSYKKCDCTSFLNTSIFTKKI